MLDISNIVAAFSEDQVQRLTGLTKGRLRYWHKTGFFKPSYADVDTRLPYSRFYSFKDIVALRTIELLRVKNEVPLQHLRKVADKLAHLSSDLWTNTTLYVLDRRVIFVNPETGAPEEIVSGQYILELPLKQVISDTSADIDNMKRRSQNEVGKITRSRAIAHNSWVIAGTRIPVGAIRRLYEDGYSPSDIIGEYPDLTIADVEAALAHDITNAA